MEDDARICNGAQKYSGPVRILRDKREDGPTKNPERSMCLKHTPLNPEPCAKAEEKNACFVIFIVLLFAPRSHLPKVNTC